MQVRCIQELRKVFEKKTKLWFYFPELVYIFIPTFKYKTPALSKLPKTWKY